MSPLPGYVHDYKSYFKVVGAWTVPRIGDYLVFIMKSGRLLASKSFTIFDEEYVELDPVEKTEETSILAGDYAEKNHPKSDASRFGKNDLARSVRRVCLF
jgi:hypothetical protein